MTIDRFSFDERLRRRRADEHDLVARSTATYDALCRMTIEASNRSEHELIKLLVDAADCIHDLQPRAQVERITHEHMQAFRGEWLTASALLHDAWCALGFQSHHSVDRDAMLAKIRELRRTAGAVPVPELTSLLEVARDAGATDPTLEVTSDGLRLTIGPDDNVARIGTFMLAHAPAMRPFVGTHASGLFKYDRRPCPRCAEMDGWGCERHQRVT